MTNTHLSAIIVVALMIALLTGCIYNNAERQAKDIKACESVGARWQYSSLTKQVINWALCTALVVVLILWVVV